MTAALLTLSLPALLAAEDARPLSAAEFEARFTAYRALARDRDLPPTATVPGGVRLLRSVGGVRAFSGSKRRAIARSLASDLVDARDDLIRDGVRWERALAKLNRGVVPARRRGEPTLAGPADRREARRLIALIQSVIAPDTWDVNGGPSNATYYELYQALVIKAPQSVHGEVGAALGGLRK